MAYVKAGLQALAIDDAGREVTGYKVLARKPGRPWRSRHFTGLGAAMNYQRKQPYGTRTKLKPVYRITR